MTAAFDQFREHAEALSVFAEGDRVELFWPSHRAPLSTGLVGTVLFVDSEWVYWQVGGRRDRHVRASRRDVLRKVGSR